MSLVHIFKYFSSQKINNLFKVAAVKNVYMGKYISFKVVGMRFEKNAYDIALQTMSVSMSTSFWIASNR